MEFPLIAAQPGIWLADKLSEFDNAYTVTHFLELRGNLDVKLLQDAIKQGMQETDTLQMTYQEVDGEVIQVLRDESMLPEPEVLDMRSHEVPYASVRSFMEDDMKTNVRLDSGTPPIRHTIMQIDEDSWIWYQRYHHIQLDAYSFTALTRRMVDIYSSRKNKRPEATKPFDPFNKVVEEYREYQGSAKRTKDAAFWKEFCGKLPNAASPSPMPLNDHKPSKHIIRRSINLDSQQFKSLCQACSSSAGVTATQSDIAIALIAVWLLRLSNCSEMSMGFIFMRRLGSAALNTAGPFINVLPMPVNIKEGDKLSSLAKDIGKTLKLLRRHQRYDSENIVRDSGRTWEDAPLYGPVINFKAFDYHLDFTEVECRTHHLASGPIRDIEMVLYITDDGEVQVEYLANADRYDEVTLSKHLDRLPLMLQQLASSEETISCHEVNIMLPDEEHLISQINSTSVPDDHDGTLSSLLLHESQRSATRLALQDVNVALTYQEMIDQSKTLAHHLVEQGVRPGDIVAVALRRSVLLSLALQAVVLAGATWLPLDTDYPTDRLQLMLDDAKPNIVIANENLNALKVPGNVLIFNKLFKPEELKRDIQLPIVKPNDSAYIIYTSGSTGKPKGALVSHRAVVNRLIWMQEQYKLQLDDVVIQKTPSSFDVSVWEFFWPLITGAKLFMAPPEAHRDAESIQRLISDYKITTIHFVPSMLSSFLTDANHKDPTKLSMLRRVFCSGEALSTRLAKDWQTSTGVPLYNLYGPTEAAIDVTAYPAFGSHLSDVSNSVPIGFPMRNNQLHVLDEHMQQLPLGIVGDLYISGTQLAEGYLNQPQMTADKFVTFKNTRMYRTGDVALRLASGALEFHGRTDDQVKLRGQRLELGEIDAVLAKIPGVSESVTQARIFTGSPSNDADSRQLISYIVPKEDCDLDVNEIRAQLVRLLPPYMVPVKFMLLDYLPIGVTGKLNTRALPLPHFITDNENRHLPDTELEKFIASCFKELLGYERDIYKEDDFFSLGGHSLLAVRLAAMLRNKLNLPVTIGQIMQSPRIDVLAAQLEDETNRDSWRKAGFERVLKLRNGNANGKNIYCIHPASGFAWQFSVLGRYLDPCWSLVGIQSDGVLARAQSLEEIVEEQFKTIVEYGPGPYYLLGYSLGGTLAHALAARLETAGEEVAFLGLLDTWPPETQNWDEKLGKNIVDQAVVEEMQRERQQFIAAQQGAFDEGGSSELFDTIEKNYASAVRILATARSSQFKGTTTLFVAQKTLPKDTDLQQVWKKWTGRLNTIMVDSSHVDIISPTSFQVLGPQVNELISHLK